MATKEGLPEQGTFHEEFEQGHREALEESARKAREALMDTDIEEPDCKVCEDSIGGCPQCGFGRKKKK